MAEKMYVKLVYRPIAKVINPTQDVGDSVDEVQEYLSELYEKGYVLFATHYLGEDEYNFRMVFVLHRPK